MVFKNNCPQLILSHFPDFLVSSHWKEHIEFWKDEESSNLCGLFSTFGHYVSEELRKNKSNVDFVNVFNFIEYLLVNGDQEVRDAVATCFLENLINYTTSSYPELQLPAKTFIHLLGTKSREYCKGWDEFTGVKTEGLWDE